MNLTLYNNYMVEINIKNISQNHNSIVFSSTTKYLCIIATGAPVANSIFLKLSLSPITVATQQRQYMLMPFDQVL